MILRKRTRLTQHSTRTYAINVPNMVEWRCAATTTLEVLVFAQLKMAGTPGELQAEAEKIWVPICPGATALWHTCFCKLPGLRVFCYGGHP